MTTDIGKKIREARIRNDMYGMDLAKTVGKTNAFISMVELGKREPGMKLLYEIAEVLGCTVELVPKQGQTVGDMSSSHPDLNINDVQVNYNLTT